MLAQPRHLTSILKRARLRSGSPLVLPSHNSKRLILLGAVLPSWKMTFWRPVSDAFRRSSALSLFQRRHEEAAKKDMAEEDMAEEDMDEEDKVEEDRVEEDRVEEDIREEDIREEDIREEDIREEDIREEDIREEEIVEESTLMYDYEQLDLTKQQIRLITLHSAVDPSEPIRCDIQTFDTETSPPYIALSYTWGPEDPKRTIMINGRWLSIRKNLYDFLDRYRSDSDNSTWHNYLWIDQICISQAHEGERNHQVRLMSQIYSRSLRTIIWLGEESRVAAQRYQKNRNIDDVFTLFRNPYFTRLWVVQEIFLSSCKRVLCGNIWLDLDDLVSTLEGSNTSRFPPVEFLNFQLLEGRYINAPHKRGQEALEYCIKRFSEYCCEDPRDKIYGLLGLVRESERPEVDYSKSTEEVYLQVVTSNVLWTPRTYVPSTIGNMFEASRRRLQNDLSIEVMIDLSRSMGLMEHHVVLRGMLKEIRDRWTGGSLKEIESGFQRRICQSRSCCHNHDHAEKGCCSDRWWFLWDGVKQYRDRSSYNNTL
jgi:hypothetical protein